MIPSSFFPICLRPGARLLREVPRDQLALRGRMGSWARSFAFSFGNCAALHPHAGDVSPQQVQRVHRLGGRVQVWTVNEPSEEVRLSGWGLDGIITDDPRMALQAVGRSL